jgi:hypothetical protein
MDYRRESRRLMRRVDAQPTVSALLRREHGLMPLWRVVLEFLHRGAEANSALVAAGHRSLARWLSGRLDPMGVLQVPSEQSRVADEYFVAHCSETPPEGWRVPWDPVYFSYIRELRYLDERLDMSPREWVTRVDAALPPDVVEELAPQVRVELRRTSPDPERIELPGGAWWMWGAQLSKNPYWLLCQEVAARNVLDRMEGPLGEAQRRGVQAPERHRDKPSGWDVVWVERPAQLRMRRSGARRPTRAVTTSVWLPELEAVPFYHTSQLDELVEGMLRGKWVVSLLDERASDAAMREVRLLAMLRAELGYPALETRGRPSRAPALVEQCGNLVYQEGMTKYRAAKTMGMKPSTFRGYLRAYQERHGIEETGGERPHDAGA